ncbi:hypothetical protein [Cesiribacter sp. SM1]|uniref:hypothetical protein n=1 Tax=Cesiribacter sp. SM1 TaxID=2861196 RepID=UPI001CD3EC4B|nr:hypothetical protein [Cesiribacter sp. SM1]
MILLLSSLISAIALLLLYGMLFSIWGKDMSALLRMKIEKALIVVVAGIVLMVWLERWIETQLLALFQMM